jgi:radical SAM superfamily enzyme YgiQ (UPF0313 family)
MKSKDLRNIKKVEDNQKKKILFINPWKKTSMVNIPHMGLAILASILKKRGHDVLIVDYQLVHNAPSVDFFVNKFKPDVIGLSIYTANFNEAEDIKKGIIKIAPDIPLLVGGPHPTLYFEEMSKDENIDYVVVGEAELSIIDLVENAKKQKNAKIISSAEIANLDDIPHPDYMLFYKYEFIRSYPIMTSRGCPYNCSFCPVMSISFKKWRARNPEDCIREIENAINALSKHLHVLIQDDNPLIDRERFYRFLEMYTERIEARLSVTNIRADTVTDKLLILLKKAHCDSVGLGVEHAYQDVFSRINKGETLQQIADAARLIKKNGMSLSFCFIIGLPGDTLERTKHSIRFAEKLRPDYIYWNMVMPYKSTKIREWFEKHGTLYNEIGNTSFRNDDFKCDNIVVETPDFSVEERKKAHYMCLFRTIDTRLKLSKLPQIANIAIKYKLYQEFFYWLPRGIIKNIRVNLKVIQKAHAYYKREGLNELIKRIAFLRAE